MYSQNRESYRYFFQMIWEKSKSLVSLTDMEKRILKVIKGHPEFHIYLESSDALKEDYQFMDSNTTQYNNPFLHMSLHVTLQEQVMANIPTGIQIIHKKLTKKFQDSWAAEHVMMECLTSALWKAQNHVEKDINNQSMAIDIDRKEYFACLKELI